MESDKAKSQKRNKVLEYAQSLGYSVDENETGTFVKFTKEIIIEREKVCDIVIEHTKYNDCSDEYIYLTADCTLFARETRELANELNNAASIAEKLDKLN